MDQAPTGRLPAPRTRSLNSLSTATSDAETKRSAIRGRSPSMRGPPPPPGATRPTTSRIPAGTGRSVSPSPRVSASNPPASSASSASSTTRSSVMSATGARTVTRGGPPPPPTRGSQIRVPSPSPRRASMPQLGEEGAPADGEGSASAADEKPRSRGRSGSSASETSVGMPKPTVGRQLTQPVAPSFMARPKTTANKQVAAKMPPPAPVRKMPAASAAKAQELQARLDALKKTAQQLRTQAAAKPSGIKKPGEKSAPSSPRASEDANVSKTVDSTNAVAVEEQAKKEGEMSKEERGKLESSDSQENKTSEMEKDELEQERKQQIEKVKQEQAKKDSLQIRAAAALERNMSEQRRRDSEAETQRKEEEERKRREREREEEDEARKKQEQAEREEVERKRKEEEEEERKREEERIENEKKRQAEEEERRRLREEKEREEDEQRKQEQERLLQATEEAEREAVKKRLEEEEAERARIKEEENKKRVAAEEATRKQREKEEEERKKQEEERRKQREKEEEERRQQKLKEEEERRKQREKEEEERKQQKLKEEEERKQQKLKEEEERRKQKEKEEEEERKKQKEKEEDARKKKEKEEEERKKQKEKEEEERKKQKQAEEKRKAEEAETKRLHDEEEKKKKAVAAEQAKKELEEKKAREEKAKAALTKQNDKQEDTQDDLSRPSFSTVTKAKMAGPTRKARSDIKFDARASTDVVMAPRASDLAMRTDTGPEPEDEPRDSDLRPERKPFLGVGMPGLAGLAAQATAGLAGLKSVSRTGDRTRSPASRKGPIEISLKTDSKHNEQAVATQLLDALDAVAKGQSWAILGFDNDVFSLVSTGEGTGQPCLEAMKEHLTPTNICFLYFHSGSGGSEEGTAKCNEIMWQGEKTKLLVKARAGAIRETLHLFTKRCFTIGVQKEASAHEDLDVSRIFASSGEVTSSPAQETKVAPQLATPPKLAAVAPSPVSRINRTPPNVTTSPGASNPLRPDIQWTGQEEVIKAVKEFLDIEGQGAFFVLDIEGPKKNEVKVAAVGAGALTDEWREKHCGATKCSVFVIKAENKEAGYVSLEKIVYIQWVGKQVKVLEKGRAKEIYAGLKEFVREQCGTLAGELEVLEGAAEEVNLQAVTESITGSRQRGPAMGATLTRKIERSTGAIDLSYADEPQLREIIAQISQEKLTWVALTYSATKAATLEILGSGVGENTSISWGKEPTKEQEEEQNQRDRLPDTPTAQYKQFCKQSNIVFIVHRFLRIPEQFQFSKEWGSYQKSHFGLMMWQGEDCRVMDKAASSHHWKDFCTLVRDIMEKAGVYVEAGVYVATKLEELNPRDIRKGMRMDMY